MRFNISEMNKTPHKLLLTTLLAAALVFSSFGDSIKCPCPAKHGQYTAKKLDSTSSCCSKKMELSAASRDHISKRSGCSELGTVTLKRVGKRLFSVRSVCPCSINLCKRALQAATVGFFPMRKVDSPSEPYTATVRTDNDSTSLFRDFAYASFVSSTPDDRPRCDLHCVWRC